MSYPYSIKEKEPTLVQDAQPTHTALRRKSQHWLAQIRICHTVLRRKNQHWFAQIRICHTALRRKSQDMSYPYSIKEKEPTLVCPDQDMSYPYSIKEKEPTLVCSDQDMSLRRRTNTGLLRSGYVIQH